MFLLIQLLLITGLGSKFSESEYAVGDEGIWEEDIEDTFFLNEETVGETNVVNPIEAAVGDLGFSMDNELVNLLEDLKAKTRRNLLLSVDNDGKISEDADSMFSGVKSTLDDLAKISNEAKTSLKKEAAKGYNDLNEDSADNLGVLTKKLNNNDRRVDIENVRDDIKDSRDDRKQELKELDDKKKEARANREKMKSDRLNQKMKNLKTMAKMGEKQAKLGKELEKEQVDATSLKADTMKEATEAAKADKPVTPVLKAAAANAYGNVANVAPNEFGAELQAMNTRQNAHNQRVDALRARIQQLRAAKLNRMDQHAENIKQQTSYSALFNRYAQNKKKMKARVALKNQIATHLADHIVDRLNAIRENGNTAQLASIEKKYPFVEKFLTGAPENGPQSPNQGPLIKAVRKRLRKVEEPHALNSPVLGKPLMPMEAQNPQGMEQKYMMSLMNNAGPMQNGPMLQQKAKVTTEGSIDGSVQASSKAKTEEKSQEKAQSKDSQAKPEEKSPVNQIPKEAYDNADRVIHNHLKQALGPKATADEVPGSPGPHGNTMGMIPGPYIHPGLGPLRVTHPETRSCEAAKCDCGFKSIRWAYKNGCYNVNGECAKCDADKNKKIAAVGFSYKENKVVGKTLPLFTYRTTEKEWHNKPDYRSSCPEGKVLTGIGTIVTQFDDKFKHSMRLKCAVASEKTLELDLEEEEY